MVLVSLDSVHGVEDAQVAARARLVGGNVGGLCCSRLPDVDGLRKYGTQRAILKPLSPLSTCTQLTVLSTILTSLIPVPVEWILLVILCNERASASEVTCTLRPLLQPHDYHVTSNYPCVPKAEGSKLQCLRSKVALQ